MKTDAKILICYNSPASIFQIYNGKPVNGGAAKGESSPNDLSETGFSREIGFIKKSLLEKYSCVDYLAVDGNIERTISQINNYSPDVIFNFVEAVEGISSYEYCIAGVFQLLGYNITGNVPSCLGNCLNKERTKNILSTHGIDTPDFLTVKFNTKLSKENFNLRFPVILKLLNEDASIGISEFSVVDDFEKLDKQLGFLQKMYRQDVIIEEYIEGRELNAAILGDSVLPISEIEFKTLPDGLPKIVTYDGKWMADSVYYENTKPVCPARLNQTLKKRIEETALRAYEAMGCRDYARVDMRLDKNNVPFVIEVNPNPDISTDSGFARAASAAGLSYPDLLAKIVGFALIRKRNDTQVKAS